jgi:ornithine cyclodeaminase
MLHRVLIVNQREVAGLLPMPACIDAMAEALKALSCGEAAMPLRQIVWVPDRTGALGLMPSRLASPDGGAGSLGAKIVTFFPKNEGTELDSHQGAVLLFEAERGRLLAVIDAT